MTTIKRRCQCLIAIPALFVASILSSLLLPRATCIDLHGDFGLAARPATPITEAVGKRHRWSDPVASRDALFDRHSSLHVTRGLYVLRYEQGGASHDHPVAMVKPAAGSEGVVQVISAPGGVEGWLDRPGAAVLVRAEDIGKIQIGVKRSGSNGSLEAAFRLESISMRLEDKPNPISTNARETGPSQFSPISIASSANGSEGTLFLAHVSRRGDVSVRANEWAGGPEAPGRIEGLAILGSGKQGLRTEVQVLPGPKDATWSDWVGAGVFAGTRGRHQPLVGVRLRLTGDQAHHSFIHAEALFLASAIMIRRGKEVECVSQSGRDPLVGFRFEICPERRASVRPAMSPVEPDGYPRVRIFRANAG